MSSDFAAYGADCVHFSLWEDLLGELIFFLVLTFSHNLFGSLPWKLNVKFHLCRLYQASVNQFRTGLTS